MVRLSLGTEQLKETPKKRLKNNADFIHTNGCFHGYILPE